MRDIRFAAKIIGKFKSIQSAIFAVVTVLLLSAVLVITGVSMRYTRNSIFENSCCLHPEYRAADESEY